MPAPSLTTGPQNLLTDVRGLRVGHAQDANLLSNAVLSQVADKLGRDSNLG